MIEALVFVAGTAAGWAARAVYGWHRRRHIDPAALALDMVNHARCVRGHEPVRSIGEMLDARETKLMAARAIAVLRG